MPFETVGGRNFEQVLLSIKRRLRPFLAVLDLLPPHGGLRRDLAAMEQMVGDAADELYTKVHTDHEHRIKALEAADPARTALIVARLGETVTALTLK